jgi:tyrosine-protein kinase
MSSPSPASETPQPAGVLAYTRIARRRAVLILLTAVLVGAVAMGVSTLQAKRYEATAALLFRPAQAGQALADSRAAGVASDPYRDAATNVELVSLPEIARRAAGPLRSTTDDVAHHIRVQAKGQSDVVEIVADAPRAGVAQRLANTYASTFIGFRRETDRAGILETQRLVDRKRAELAPAERNGPRGRSLADRSDQLAVLASLQTGNAELVQSATLPSSPASPRPLRNGVLGAILGLVVGFVLAVARERLDRRLRDDEEIEGVAALPVLGRIANARSLKRTGRAALADLEPFRLLHANLRYRNVQQPIRSVLVTSPATEDGKSVVAANLAAAAASVGARALLIEADFHRPVMARRYELDPSVGLSSVAAGHVALGKAVQEVEVDVGDDGAAFAMQVLVAGTPPRSAADLLGSGGMARLLHQDTYGYDLVVIDTPPMAMVADAAPLVRDVDCVLLVARPGHTPARALRRLREQLADLGPSLLALVIDGIEEPDAVAHYAYERPSGRSGV